MSLNFIGEPALAGLIATFMASILVLLTKTWHTQLTSDGTAGVQKVHTTPTPRVGGLPIVLGLGLAWWLASADVQNLLGPMLLAGAPAFLFGFAEDLTKRVGVTQRLLATMASGVLAYWLTDMAITRVDVWGVDTVLMWAPLSVLFTAFCIGGVANSVNIIDGFNGLSSSMVMIALLSFGALSYSLGDTALAGVCVLVAACTFGFFCVNWPFGKLFLGDGGSYLLGFCLAWVAVLLMHRHPDVSAFAVLLVCVHPVTEVLFSIYRRKVRHQPFGMPDRLHFHSLFNRRVTGRWTKNSPPFLRNSLTGISIGALTAPPALVALWVHQSVAWSALAMLGFVLLYVTVYARMVRFCWCSPIKFLLTKPVRLGAVAIR